MQRIKFLAQMSVFLLITTAGAQAEVKLVRMKVGGHLCSMCSFNIKKAVSLLDFGPKLEDVKITDFYQGLCEFAPKANKPVRFADLREMLKKSGFKLISADITVSGKLLHHDSGWWMENPDSGQRFELAGDELGHLIKENSAGSDFEATGDWQTGSKSCNKCEVIHMRSGKRVAQFSVPNNNLFLNANQTAARFVGLGTDSIRFVAPIRTTSPSLAVFKGGEFTLRYHFTKQHLGNLKVNHHEVRLGFTYTPTPKLQFEGEIPYHIFDQGGTSGHNAGNAIVWAKYRFHNSLETGGDRQASIRVGIELPTANRSAVSNPGTDETEFIRRQLRRIDGGLSPHVDLSYARAKRRIVYGANIESIMRSEFEGVRLGHEVRLNTDLEYILLPIKYQGPKNELRVILETTYLHKARGRIDGREVPGSSASEFYVAPALQFAFNPRFVIEGSYQHPVSTASPFSTIHTSCLRPDLHPM